MSMLEYPKIETLYERGTDFSVTDVLKSPVIGTISKWHVTEKIDGTNIRIDLRHDDDQISGAGEDVVTFGGRSATSQMPADLVKYLTQTFTLDQMQALRQDDDPVSITLFGEGYGPGIQKGGGLYRKDKAVILFDILIADRWWLEYDAVKVIAERLGVPVVPSFGVWTLEEIRKMVPFLQSTAAAEPRDAEGVVAKPIETLYDKHHKRLVIKLKASDFRSGKR